MAVGQTKDRAASVNAKRGIVRQLNAPTAAALQQLLENAVPADWPPAQHIAAQAHTAPAAAAAAVDNQAGAAAAGAAAEVAAPAAAVQEAPPAAGVAQGLTLQEARACLAVWQAAAAQRQERREALQRLLEQLDPTHPAAVAATALQAWQQRKQDAFNAAQAAMQGNLMTGAPTAEKHQQDAAAVQRVIDAMRLRMALMEAESDVFRRTQQRDEDAPALLAFPMNQEYTASVEQLLHTARAAVRGLLERYAQLVPGAVVDD